MQRRPLWPSPRSLLLAFAIAAAPEWAAAQTAPPAPSKTTPTTAAQGTAAQGTAAPGTAVPTNVPPAAAPGKGAGLSQTDLDLIRQLRAGGLAIVMRHAPADPDKADASPLDFKAIRTQQPLTEAGRMAARAFGDALRTLGVPVSDVSTSRFQRALQTAVLAGFPTAKPVVELTEGSLVTSPNEQRRRSAGLKQLLVAPLPPGSNRLLVTHRINLQQAFGKEWFDVKEGESSIFRIDNGSYVLVARLHLSDWTRLAEISAR